MKVQYVYKRCHYDIQFKQERVLIQIEDFYKRKAYSLNIDNAMIQNYRIKTQQLYQLMYKQYHYQSSKEKQMIQIKNNTLYIAFNFPKAPFKQIQFQCIEKTTEQPEQSSKNLIDKLAQTKMKQILVVLENASKKLFQTIQIKVSEAVKVIQDKLQNVILTIDSEIHKKMVIFQQFCKEKQNQYKEGYKDYLSDSVDKVIEDNQKYFNQFIQVKLDLESGIQVLNQNIKQNVIKIIQLQKEIQNYKEEFQQQLLEMNQNQLKMQGSIWKQIKEINLSIKKIIEQEHPFQINRDKNKIEPSTEFTNDILNKIGVEDYQQMKKTKDFLNNQVFHYFADL